MPLVRASFFIQSHQYKVKEKFVKQFQESGLQIVL
jgi:hypothetical protein